MAKGYPWDNEQDRSTDTELRHPVVLFRDRPRSAVPRQILVRSENKSFGCPAIFHLTQTLLGSGCRDRVVSFGRFTDRILYSLRKGFRWILHPSVWLSGSRQGCDPVSSWQRFGTIMGRDRNQPYSAESAGGGSS